MPSTLSSLDSPHTDLSPSAPPAYLHHVIASTLKRKGFEAAEAGALVEMERLVERRESRPLNAGKRPPGEIVGSI